MKARWSTSDRSVYTEEGIKLACIQQINEMQYYIRWGRNGRKSYPQPFDNEIDAFKYIVKLLDLDIIKH